jgi:hypothetical protein
MHSKLLYSKLKQFKKKYFLNLLFRGFLIFGLYFGIIWMTLGLLEDAFWFTSTTRLALFLISLIVLISCLTYFVGIPLLALTRLDKSLTDEIAAKQIGKHFPLISDRLLNLVQLESLNNSESSALLEEALSQKSRELSRFDFREAINLKLNAKYGFYFAVILFLLLSVSFISPSTISDAPSRVLQFEKSFTKPAPFEINLNSELTAIAGEPYELKASLSGNSIPKQVFIKENQLTLPMTKVGNEVSFLFPSISKTKKFSFSASGFDSQEYKIEVHQRPEIQDFSIVVYYPKYTKLENPLPLKTGNVIVPEGTKLYWSITSEEAKDVFFLINKEPDVLDLELKNRFIYSKTAVESFDYEISLVNEHAKNKTPITYNVSVVKDQYPEIEIAFFPDTVSFDKLVLSGVINDDYGFSRLNLYYRVNNDEELNQVQIPISNDINSQPFYFNWSLDSLNLLAEDFMEIYAQVSDNDGVNGPKSASSERFFLKKASKAELEKRLNENSKQTEENLNEAVKDAKSLNEKIEEVQSRLKNDQSIDWQEEKLLNELLKDREKIEEQIQKIQKEHSELNELQEEFGNQNEKLREKSKELQKLMDEILDDETKKLYEELQKLLQEEKNTDEVQKQLSSLKSKENNLEKELERALELFKRMKMEIQLDLAAKKLEELANDQEKLANQGGQKEDSLAQKEINEKYEEIKAQIESAEDLNEELKRPEDLDDLNSEKEDLEDTLDEIEEDFNKSDGNDEKDSSKERQNKMKKASESMKSLSKKLMAMQASAEMEMMEENIDNLRDILDNLIKLSFEQETILEDIKKADQIDPRFIILSQNQLTLGENMKVIEDSLLSLASRVVQISNFVTREVSAVNEHMSRAMKELRDRNKGRALADQQFAMTSMNNLALLLSDVLEQMQMSMAESMGNPQKGNKKGQSMPSMSELQKQLSQQIQELKKSGKSGKQLSEELAKLAAEQSQLRQAMQEMSERLGKDNPKPGEKEGNDGVGSKLSEAIKKMEENEVDLVNKRLTQELIDRQQDIITRMLEAEESLRDQNKSPERKGETAGIKDRTIPPAIEEYLKAKEGEIELLKTIPLDLNSFYRKEVNEYFRRLSLPNQK